MTEIFGKGIIKIVQPVDYGYTYVIIKEYNKDNTIYCYIPPNWQIIYPEKRQIGFFKLQKITRGETYFDKTGRQRTALSSGTYLIDFIDESSELFEEMVEFLLL